MDGREDGGMEGGGKRSVDETVANLELKRNCKLMTKEEGFHFNVYDTKKKNVLAGRGLKNHTARIPPFLHVRILRSSRNRELPTKSHPQEEKCLQRGLHGHRSNIS